MKQGIREIKKRWNNLKDLRFGDFDDMCDEMALAYRKANVYDHDIPILLEICDSKDVEIARLKIERDVAIADLAVKCVTCKFTDRKSNCKVR